MIAPAAIASLGGGNLGLSLILTMVIAVLLGTGLSSVAAYVLVALICVPALIEMGVGLLQSHLFAYYFACLSFIIPPVAMAAVVGAEIAGARYFRTAFETFKIALFCYIIPFLFILAPVLLLQPQAALSAAIDIIAILLLIIAFQVAFCNHFFLLLKRLERVAFIVVAVLLMLNIVTNNYGVLAGGIGLFVLLSVQQWKRAAQLKQKALNP